MEGDEISLEEILQEIKTKPTVPVWPHAGMALGLTKGGTYRAVQRKEIDVLEFGRLYKAVSAPLRKRLGLEAAA
jgi:hypothetical protein